VPLSADPRVEQKLKSLGRMIGNTPMLAIEFKFRGEPRVLHAKSEHFNMTGSIKDRMALHIMRRAYREGRIAPGDIVAEATAGTPAFPWRRSAGRSAIRSRSSCPTG